MLDEILVDARGHRCPVPTLRLRRVAADAAAGQFIRLLTDDPLAKIDVPHFAAQAKLTIVESTSEGSVISFLLSTAV